MGIMRSDTFILVDGPCIVCNGSLAAAVAAHEARARDDTNAVLTAVCTQMPQQGQGRGGGAGSRGSAHSVTRMIVSPADGKLHAYV